VDSTLYLGVGLDTNAPEKTHDYKLWVRRIKEYRLLRNCTLNIETADGTEEVLLDVTDEEPLRLDFDTGQKDPITCEIRLTGIEMHPPREMVPCTICGEDLEDLRGKILQARLQLNAPDQVKILRGNAKRRF